MVAMRVVSTLLAVWSGSRVSRLGLSVKQDICLGLDMMFEAVRFLMFDVCSKLRSVIL